MAQAFYGMAEVDQNGNEVATYSFGDEQTVNWMATYHFDGDLKYFAIEAPMDLANGVSGEPFSVEVDFFLSQVSGMINAANTTITPRVLESTFRVSNYTYANPNNHLRLKVAAAHGGVKAVGTGMLKADADGLAEMYVRLAGHCHVLHDWRAYHGDVYDVLVSSWTESASLKAVINRSHIKLYLDIKYAGTWKVLIANVNFPAGASNIIYDPTLGGGTTKAVEPTSASSLVLPSLFLIFTAILGAFLF